MKNLEQIREVFESNGIEMTEYSESSYGLCGYELNCYTDGGVNEVLFLDFRDKNSNPLEPQDVIEEFENYVKDYDVDDRIEINRFEKSYVQNFTIRQSVEDFESFEQKLRNLLVLLKTNVKVKDGYKYSTKSFEGYKYRVKFVAENKDGEQVVNTDVYTDNEDKATIHSVLCGAAKKKGYVTHRFYTGIVNWATKEQDDLDTEFLEETFKDI